MSGLLLAVLEAGPAHGHALIDILRTRSGGTFDLPTGTVYPALNRLHDLGLIASTWSDKSGRRRRVYKLTAAGRRGTVSAAVNVAGVLGRGHIRDERRGTGHVNLLSGDPQADAVLCAYLADLTDHRCSAAAPARTSWQRSPTAWRALWSAGWPTDGKRTDFRPHD